jgi:broad specificity phosphatase PhoE
VLIIVRHGRTAANAQGLLLGRLDPELDDEGRRQAAAVAATLDGADRIVSSPLARTRETAALISASTGTEVEIDERWIELDYGELDGVPLVDIPPETWASWRREATFCPPGGESLVDLGLRVRESLEELAADALTRDIVVVSHVSPIKAAVIWALGVTEAVTWRMFLAPASITRIAVQRGPVLQTFNETAHLARVTRTA